MAKFSDYLGDVSTKLGAALNPQGTQFLESQRRYANAIAERDAIKEEAAAQLEQAENRRISLMEEAARPYGYEPGPSLTETPPLDLLAPSARRLSRERAVTGAMAGRRAATEKGTAEMQRRKDEAGLGLIRARTKQALAPRAGGAPKIPWQTKRELDWTEGEIERIRGNVFQGDTSEEGALEELMARRGELVSGRPRPAPPEPTVGKVVPQTLDQKIQAIVGRAETPEEAVSYVNGLVEAGELTPEDGRKAKHKIVTGSLFKRGAETVGGFAKEVFMGSTPGSMLKGAGVARDFLADQLDQFIEEELAKMEGEPVGGMSPKGQELRERFESRR